MLRKVRVVDSGDTDLLPGSFVDIFRFEEANEKTILAGGRPAYSSRVLLGITIKEHEGECHISLRSKEPVNADEIAEIFGGGGHRLAAGITIKGTVEETARLLVAEAVKHLPKEQA